MKDLKQMDTKDIVFRLNDINKELDNLTMEYNELIYELWDRIPSIKNDVDIQPKQYRR